MNPLRWLLNLRRPEANDSAGYGPFRLPEDARWMEIAAIKHDADYEVSDTPKLVTVYDNARRSESDAHLFYAWSLQANAEKDPIKRCKMYGQICRYWPIARYGGQYLWSK